MGTKEFNILDKLIFRLRFRKIVSYIEKNDIILDFGCGYQADALNYVKNKIKEGIGFDYDCETAQLAPNIRIQRFNFIDTLPLKSNSLHKVLFLAVLEHIEIEKVPNLLRECNRVLKPGGKIVLTTPTPAGKKILEFLAFTLGIISRKEITDHKKYYDYTDLKNLAESCGFNIQIYRTFQLGCNSICVMVKD